MFSYLNIPIHIYYDTDTYIAECDTIQGAFAEGETPELAVDNLRAVIKMIQAYDRSSLSGSGLVQNNRIAMTLPIVQDFVYA